MAVDSAKLITWREESRENITSTYTNSPFLKGYI